MELRLLSLNVAQPRVIAEVHGETIISAIGKIPVTSETVFVSRTNIEGDRQADLAVHGGPDKAVYAYPSEHWPWWEAKGLACLPATFGENLTLAGATEGDVHIGDRFRWGEAVLEVSQPRAPCYKFAIHAARQDAPSMMTISARCGWYFRVIEEGRAPVRNGQMTRLSVNPENPSVGEAFRALYHPRVPDDLRRKVHDTATLAAAWREGLTNRLNKGQS